MLSSRQGFNSGSSIGPVGGGCRLTAAVVADFWASFGICRTNHELFAPEILECIRTIERKNRISFQPFRWHLQSRHFRLANKTCKSVALITATISATACFAARDQKSRTSCSRVVHHNSHLQESTNCHKTSHTGSRCTTSVCCR